MTEPDEIRTKTPWTGELVDGVYLPSREEVWQRAAELRSMRSDPSNQGSPKLAVSFAGQQAEAKAREASKFVSHKRQ